MTATCKIKNNLHAFLLLQFVLCAHLIVLDVVKIIDYAAPHYKVFSSTLLLSPCSVPIFSSALFSNITYVIFVVTVKIIVAHSDRAV
jgi:hypothetical protein